MRKTITRCIPLCILILASLCSLFIGCNSPLNMPPAQGTGSLKIVLPGSAGTKSSLPTVADLAAFEVVIACPENYYQNEVNAEPGTTIAVSRLLPGDYTIDIKAYNSGNQEIFHGTGTAAVLPAETASAVIALEYTTGNLEITVTLPTPPTPPPAITPTITPTPAVTATPTPSTTSSRPLITIQKTGTEYTIIINARSTDFIKEMDYYEEPGQPELCDTSYMDHVDFNLPVENIATGDTITFIVNFMDTFHLTKDIQGLGISLEGSNASALYTYPSSTYTVTQQGNIPLTVGNAGIYATTNGINGLWFHLFTLDSQAGQYLNSIRGSFVVPDNLPGTYRTAIFKSFAITTSLDGDTREDIRPFAYGN